MSWIKLIIQAIVVLLLQVLLFDHLQISGWGFPMVYVLVLMNMPVYVPRWAEMLIGAVVGLVLDIWNSSMGVHMAACVAFTFIRPILLRSMVQDLERVSAEVTTKTVGKMEYVRCLVLLVLVHHLLVFALEAWSWQHWWIVLVQTLLSSIMTVIALVLFNFFKR